MSLMRYSPSPSNLKAMVNGVGHYVRLIYTFQKFDVLYALYASLSKDSEATFMSVLISLINASIFRPFLENGDTN